MPDSPEIELGAPASPPVSAGREEQITERLYRRFHAAKCRNGWIPPESILVHEDELRPLAEAMTAGNWDLPKGQREADRRERIERVIADAKRGEALLFGVPVRVRPLRPLFTIES